MAALPLSSRFGILNVMDASADFEDSDEEAGGPRKTQPQLKGNKDGNTSNTAASGGEGSSMSANAKKRAKKKKNKQAAELRDIAFNPSGTKGPLVASPPTSPSARLPPGLPPPDAQAGPASPTSPSLLQHLVGNPMQWEEWKRKDKGVVKGQYEDDLQKALLASKMEYEQHQQFLKEVGDATKEVISSAPPALNRKERRKHIQGKDKPHPISLHDFQAAPASATNGAIDDIELPKKPDPDPEFFNRVGKEVAEIMTKEERSKLRKKNQKLAAENVRRMQFEDNLEKRDQEIEEMKKEMEKMKAELTQVKKRNKQLCFILAQGEMKDKAEVLKQVDDLSAVKDELTAEVSELHGALEQERSKVSLLKAELQRLHEKKK